MRIVSYNVNGIRAALNKGFVDWLVKESPDVIGLQEIKALESDVNFRIFQDLGYEVYWYPAVKKGYSGVAVFSKQKPSLVVQGTGHEMSDVEGRVIRVDFGALTIINAYFPSGTSGDLRQAYKYQWLDEFYNWVEALRKERPNIIIAGDYNIAHQANDIHDPKGNKKSSGFLPEERAWMDQLLANNWVDSFRYINKDAIGAYSWWSQRFPSVRIQNKGWRIDYLCTTKILATKIKNAFILPDIKHSDHCPIVVELKK